MIIAKMLSEHIGGVKVLLDACFGNNTWSDEMILSQLMKLDSRSMIALEEGEIIGYLAFEQIMDEGSVVEVAVHPDYRRRGIARELIRSAMDNAEGLSAVFLEVRASNLPAIALYQKLGFERIAIRKDYYDDPKENAVVMEKRV